MTASSQPQLSLLYWQALATFGTDAVEETLAKPAWKESSFELSIALRNSDLALPDKLVLDIAGSKLCSYSFFADPDGERLFASPRGQSTLSDSVLSARAVTPAEALVEYGSPCLFEAADKGVGYKTRGTSRHEHS